MQRAEEDRDGAHACENGRRVGLRDEPIAGDESGSEGCNQSETGPVPTNAVQYDASKGDRQREQNERDERNYRNRGRADVRPPTQMSGNIREEHDRIAHEHCSKKQGGGHFEFVCFQDFLTRITQILTPSP